MFKKPVFGRSYFSDLFPLNYVILYLLFGGGALCVVLIMVFFLPVC